MALCDECGSTQVGEAEVEGVLVEQCALCGHLQGDESKVAYVREMQEARERGIEPIIYPLVCALEAIETFRIQDASAGRPERAEYPFVFLRVREGGIGDVERLLTSLEMANRTTTRRWVVECALQRGLLFILRPRFWKAVQDITSKDILEARADLPILAYSLRRDVSLGWWSNSREP